MYAPVVLSALFAAVALASPIANPEKKVVVHTEVEYTTEIKYITIHAKPTGASKKEGHGHHNYHWSWEHPKPVVVTEVVTVTEGDVQPTQTPASSEQAPTSSSTTSSSTSTTPTPSATPEPEAPAQEQPEDDDSEEQPEEQPEQQPEQPPETYEPEQPEQPAPQAPAGSYKQLVLEHHNRHRANHSAPPLSWDDDLEAITRKIAESCVYAHDTKTGGGGYGQNIAAGASAEEIGKVISDQFYNNEFELYPKFDTEPDKSNFVEWGHLSQIIWKDTEKVACVTMDCSARGLANVGPNVPPHFTVCNYKKPGNVEGQYSKNCLAPKGDSYLSGA